MHLDIPLIIGLILTLLVNIPQLIKTWKTHDVSGFSSATILFRILNNVCWVWYSTLVLEWLLLATSLCNVLSELILLLMKYKWTSTVKSSG